MGPSFARSINNAAKGLSQKTFCTPMPTLLHHNRGFSGSAASELMKGVFAPIVTPFVPSPTLSPSGPMPIDCLALEQNIYRWVGTDEAELDGICVMGSTGEFPLLNFQEKKSLLSYTYAATMSINPSTKLFAGTGSTSTHETIELTRYAASLGYDAAMVVTPYYYTAKADDDWLQRHFEMVANSSPIPIVLYSMPSFAGGLEVGPSLLAKLCVHPNIIGMKDSTGCPDNIKKLTQLVSELGADFHMFAGTGSVFTQCLVNGATGGIMGLSNIMGDRLRKLHALYNQATSSSSSPSSSSSSISIQQVLDLNATLADLNLHVTAKFSVPAVKQVLDWQGESSLSSSSSSSSSWPVCYGGPVRPPFTQLTDEETQALRQVYDQCNIDWNNALAALEQQ